MILWMLILSYAGQRDFTTINSKGLIFPVNSSIGHQSCTNITILDDDILEPVEFFTVVFTTTQSFVNVINDRMVIGILNDDGKPFSFLKS